MDSTRTSGSARRTWRASTSRGERGTIAAPLVVAAGAAESGEFLRQSRLLAEAWRPQVRAHLELPGLHHFSVVDALAERGQALHEATRALFA